MSLNEGDVLVGLGAEVFAPLLAAFAWWLHDSARQDGVGRLVFLARDGYMLQRAYQAVIPVSEQLPTTYMWASRRLFNLAAIRQFDPAAMEFLLGDRVVMPVGDYLRRAGLDPAGCQAEVVEAGFEGANALVQPADRPALGRLFERLEPAILAVAHRERRQLREYAAGLAVWQTDKCGVVDVGWHGSLQASLQSVLEVQPASLPGYYLGLHWGASRKGKAVRRAFLDESRPGQFLTYQRSLRRCVELFEIVLAEPNGTVVGLEKRSGKFVAVRDPDALEPADRTKVNTLQYVIDGRLAELAGQRPAGWNWSRVVRLMSGPTAAEAAVLGDIAHQEGFGGLGRKQQLASPRYSLQGYLWRPAELLWDVRKTFWRSGFLARLWAGGRG